MELQPKDIVGDDYKQAKKAIEDYSKIRPVVQLGDLYRLTSPYSGTDWASLMYVSKDKKEAAVFAYSLNYHGRTTFLEEKLKGLDPNKTYKIVELNKKPDSSTFAYDGQSFTGEYLMKVGIRINIGDAFASSVLMLTEQ